MVSVYITHVIGSYYLSLLYHCLAQKGEDNLISNSYWVKHFWMCLLFIKLLNEPWEIQVIFWFKKWRKIILHFIKCNLFPLYWTHNSALVWWKWVSVLHEWELTQLTKVHLDFNILISGNSSLAGENSRFFGFLNSPFIPFYSKQFFLLLRLNKDCQCISSSLQMSSFHSAELFSLWLHLNQLKWGRFNTQPHKTQK